jgi:anti-sigma factor RsiW
MNENRISEQDLHQFADRQLAEPRRSEVEAGLAADPEATARMENIRAMNRVLHAEYDAVLDEAIPLRLRDGLARPRRVAPWAFAVAASFAVGAFAGWLARANLQPDTIMPPAPSRVALYHEAALAHAVYAPEVRHPVEVGADQQEHLVKWLSKRLGTSLKVPNLTAAGFELMGGRLLSTSDGPGAQFMFQDAKGQRLTLYICNEKNSNKDTAFRYAREGNVSVFYWIDGASGYALSAEMERAALLNVATTVYQQLNP